MYTHTHTHIHTRPPAEPFATLTSKGVVTRSPPGEGYPCDVVWFMNFMRGCFDFSGGVEFRETRLCNTNLDQ